MQAKAQISGGKVLLSSFRNEAPFVVEFVAHHQVLGFDHIVIASNACDDGTEEILAALDALGAITHLPCAPPPEVSPQSFAYAAARARAGVDAADWLMILDADEFLNIHVGAGLLDDLIAAQVPGVDLILTNWACFGASGHDRWADAPTCTRFRQRMRTLASDNLVKSLIHKPGQWKKFSNHHPFGHRESRSLQVAFAGGLWVEEVAAQDVGLGKFRSVHTRVDSFRLAQINHYATRTEDSFALRRSRGRGSAPLGAENDRHTEKYFRRMASGLFLDETILRYQPQVAALMADYRTNPALDAAEKHALRLYDAEIRHYWQAKDAALG